MHYNVVTDFVTSTHHHIVNMMYRVPSMKEVSDVLGLPTPDHRLPFEAEVGAHPSFEEMQVAVSRNKMRPAFPDLWKNTNMVQVLTMLRYLIITALNKIAMRPIFAVFCRRGHFHSVNQLLRNLAKVNCVRKGICEWDRCRAKSYPISCGRSDPIYRY